MSAVFEALFGGLELLEGEREIRKEMRVVLDALHHLSHEHEDWLNRSHQVRVAANRLEKVITHFVLEREGSSQQRAKANVITKNVTNQSVVGTRDSPHLRLSTVRFTRMSAYRFFCLRARLASFGFGPGRTAN